MTQHHVIAGRIERDFEMAGRFAWVGQNTRDAVAYLRDALKLHGMTPQTEIAILADGAGGLSRLVRSASDSRPSSVLDWFHISMRLRPIEAMTPTIARIVARTRPDLAQSVSPAIPGVRHLLWNGSSGRALCRVRAALQAVNVIASGATPAERQYLRRFRKHL